MIKHTLELENEDYTDVSRIIYDNNLDIKIEVDRNISGEILLIGDEDHIKYLITECLCA